MDDEPLDLRIHSRGRELTPTNIPQFSKNGVPVIRRTPKLEKSLYSLPPSPTPSPPPTTPTPTHPPHHILMDQDGDEGSLVIVQTPPPVPQPPNNSVPLQISPERPELESQLNKNPGGRATSKHFPTGAAGDKDRLMKSTRLLCFLCDQKVKNGKTLETHILKSHSVVTSPTGPKVLICPICGFLSTNLDVSQLKEHWAETHSESSGGGTSGTVSDCSTTNNKNRAYYPCSHCSRMYRKQSLLEAHMRLVEQKDNWKKIIAT